MKKRILSLLLVAMMLLGLMPTATLAEEGTTAEQCQEVMDAIAATFTESTDSWTAMDMAVYETLEGKTARTTEEARKEAVHLMLAEAENTTSLSDRARLEIVLRALNVDTTELYPDADSDTAIDNAALLAGMDVTAQGHYTAPWLLLAALQGNVQFTDEQMDTILGLLKDNMGEGLFESAWGPDADTAAMTLAGAAHLYDTNADAKALTDRVLEALRTGINENGSFGNANSDAMVILGLLAVGENPYEFKSATGASIVEGLLSWVNEETNMFQSADWVTGELGDNAFATEQGFRALVGLSKYDGVHAFNIYDFSQNETQPGRVTDESSRGLTEQCQEVMDAIAATFTESTDSWTVMDMAVYETLEGKTIRTTDEARKEAIHLMLAEAENTTSLSDRARLEIVLRALGVDTTELYPDAESTTAINNAALLTGMDLTAQGHYTAPWLLLAALQGNVQFTDEQMTTILGLLKDNMGEGLFESAWGPDADTAAMTLAGAAHLYDTNADAKALTDRVLEALRTGINENGSFGNANSDAMVILGLLAVGENPYEFKSATGVSIVEGLLSWVNEETKMFQSADWVTGELSDNAFATEQGFRALVGLSKYDGVHAFNIYDFSQKETQPGRVTEENDSTGGGIVTPSDPGTDETIKVTFTLKTDKETWISKTTLSLEEGATVCDALVLALAQNDMSAEGAERGYVRAITKDGITLREFDKGANSGWQYKVNGEDVSVSLTDCTLRDGDDILWYYVTDWTTTTTWGGGISSTPNSDQEKEEDAPEELPEEESTALPFSDIENHWGKDAILFAEEKGLMTGVGDGKFDPDGSFSRAMLVTMLYRLEKAPKADGKNPFADVAEGDWYYDAVIWGAENGLVMGVTETEFAPNESITREQMATVLHRYAKAKGFAVSVEEDTNLLSYDDFDKTSEYAIGAMQWAVGAGILKGESETTLDPGSFSTRAQAATVFMRFLNNIE